MPQSSLYLQQYIVSDLSLHRFYTRFIRFTPSDIRSLPVRAFRVRFSQAQLSPINRNQLYPSDPVRCGVDRERYNSSVIFK